MLNFLRQLFGKKEPQKSELRQTDDNTYSPLYFGTSTTSTDPFSPLHNQPIVPEPENTPDLDNNNSSDSTNSDGYSGDFGDSGGDGGGGD